MNQEESAPPATPATLEARERWYYAREGETFGPMPLPRLQALFSSGEVRPHDRVWNPKFPEWVDAKDLRALTGHPPLDAVMRATSGRERAVSSPSFVSDKLPLLVLGGIVACFFLYFGNVFPGGVARQAKLTGAAQTDTDKGDDDRLAEGSDADGEIYGVEICNNTKESRMYVAVAYYDTMRSDWVARGWFPEDQGACRTAVKNLKAPIYVYAESKDGKSKWGDDAGGREFCIANERAFAVRQKDCGYLGGDQLRKQTFKRLKLNGKGGTHTWDLTE